MIKMVKTLPKTEEISYSEEMPQSTNFASRNRLCRRLQRGPDVRAKFVESHINKGIAYQLRAMRETREWSQEELAALVDMPQTAISRLESPNYGKQTVTTLKRMAKAFDVGLMVRFVPFGQLVDWVSGTPFVDTGLSSDSLDVPSFEEEERRGIFQVPSRSTHVPEYAQMLRSESVARYNAAIWAGDETTPEKDLFSSVSKMVVPLHALMAGRASTEVLSPQGSLPFTIPMLGGMSLRLLFRSAQTVEPPIGMVPTVQEPEKRLYA